MSPRWSHGTGRHIMGDDRRGDWIQTFTGRRFWPLDPRPGDVDLRDIAHALARQCRFSGHTAVFYSVAEHSVLVSRRCGDDPVVRRWGLLHDAAEAYLVDLPRPLKRLPGFAAYREAEALVMAAVCARFGLPPEMPAAVAAADEMMLGVEARSLMAPLDPEWAKWIGTIPGPGRMDLGLDPVAAEAAFLDAARSLVLDREAPCSP
jgi:hypothetical protein